MKYPTWKRQISVSFVVFAALLILPSVSHAEMTRYYSIEGFGAFLDGNPETTGLTEEGGIILAPVTRDRLVQPEVAYSTAVAHGETIVVARVDNQWTLKYLDTEKGQFCLVPANGNYKTIYPDQELQVEAVVVGMIRKFSSLKLKNQGQIGIGQIQRPLKRKRPEGFKIQKSLVKKII